MLLIKTESGQAAFKERSSRFSSRQRSAFILVDGKKTVDQLLSAASGLGVTQADLDYMIEQGFLSVNFTGAEASAPAPLGFQEAPSAEPIPMLPVQLPVAETGPPASPAPAVLTEQERYQLAKPLATQLTATLGLRGFMLNLSVESASGYQALVDLLPQIQKAVGVKAARELERALKE